MIDFLILGFLVFIFVVIMLLYKSFNDFTKENVETLKLTLENHKKINELLEENNDLKNLNNAYQSYLNGVTNILEEDVDFLNSNLVKKLSLDIAEVRDVSNALKKLKQDIIGIKLLIKEAENLKNE